MTVYTHQAAQVKVPSLADVVAWLWRWLLDAVVAAFTRPAAGRHNRRTAADREPFGLDEQWPADLATMHNQLARTDVLPVVVDAAPRTGWALDDTQQWTESDRLDADRTYAATFKFAHTDFADTHRLIHGWPDATEIALRAGLRGWDITDNCGAIHG